MKKLIAIILILTMVLSLAACGGTAPAAQDTPAPEPSVSAQEPAEPSAQEPALPPEETAEPPEGSAGPEIKAPDMVEITMDNWQDYFEIVPAESRAMWSLNNTSKDGFDRESTHFYEIRFQLKDEYAQNFREHAEYRLPENADDISLDMIQIMSMTGDLELNDYGDLQVSYSYTLPDDQSLQNSIAFSDIFGTLGKNVDTKIGRGAYIRYLLAAKGLLQDDLTPDFDQIFVPLYSIGVIEENTLYSLGIDILQYIDLEITGVSGTIPVWNEE